MGPGLLGVRRVHPALPAPCSSTLLLLRPPLHPQPAAFLNPLPTASIRHAHILSLGAGRAILDVYARREDWEVQLKSDNSPLTLADSLANQIICAQLAVSWG